LDPKLPLWELAGDDPEALVVTGRRSLEDFARHLAAADIVLGLRFPSHGEMSAALIRALGMGRPALVTAGSPIAGELPDGVVVKVSPGPREEAELQALLGELCADPLLRERIGTLAKRHVEAVHDLEAGARRLSGFLTLVHEQAPRTLAALDGDQTADPLLGYFIEEVRWGARELGLPGIHLNLEPLLRELAGGDA
jgi:hypothetical protein